MSSNVLSSHSVLTIQGHVHVSGTCRGQSQTFPTKILCWTLKHSFTPSTPSMEHSLAPPIAPSQDPSSVTLHHASFTRPWPPPPSSPMPSPNSNKDGLFWLHPYPGGSCPTSPIYLWHSTVIYTWSCDWNWSSFLFFFGSFFSHFLPHLCATVTIANPPVLPCHTTSLTMTGVLKTLTEYYHHQKIFFSSLLVSCICFMFLHLNLLENQTECFPVTNL